MGATSSSFGSAQFQILVPSNLLSTKLTPFFLHSSSFYSSVQLGPKVVGKMKLVLLTWLFCSLVVATVGNKQKAISFFSVVSFPNDECPLKTDTVSKGICMTSSECSEAGGRMDGNCASGFGTCCFLL